MLLPEKLDDENVFWIRNSIYANLNILIRHLFILIAKTSYKIFC